MTFKEWLEELGDERVARMLGVTPRAVKAWRHQDRYPRPEQARRLCAIDKRLSMDAIYAEWPKVA